MLHKHNFYITSPIGQQLNVGASWRIFTAMTSATILARRGNMSAFLLRLTSLLCALTAGALPPGSLRQCGSIVVRLPVSTSHRRIELSLLPEKAVVSSGDSTTHVGVNLCPRICPIADAAICCPCKPFATYGGGRRRREQCR